MAPGLGALLAAPQPVNSQPPTFMCRRRFRAPPPFTSTLIGRSLPAKQRIPMSWWGVSCVCFLACCL